jgi:hypothetical protein
MRNEQGSMMKKANKKRGGDSRDKRRGFWEFLS